MTENQVSYIIRGSIFRVYNALGPGLMESAYEAALKYEIQKSGLLVRSQVILPMIYDEIRIDVGYRLDLLVEELVVVEIKSVEMISNLHHRQLITYLKLSGYKLGLLVNFNSGNIENGIFRKAYGL